MTAPIDLTQSEQYILSIRLSTDGFSFSIHNPSDNRNLLFKSYSVNTQRSMAANAKAFLADTQELHHTFKQVNILIHSSRYTPVPFDLFEDEQMECFFYQNLPKQNNEVILCNILGKSNVVILFGIDKLTHLFFSEHFPKARFFASISPQIEYFAIRNKVESGSNRLYACLHPTDMDVCCFNNGKLQLVNTFSGTQAEDQCYYLLNLWQQLKYSQENDELYLTGSVSYRNDLTELLKKYIRRISIINNSQTETDTFETDKPAEIVPFDMQSLFLCE